MTANHAGSPSPPGRDVATPPGATRWALSALVLASAALALLRFDSFPVGGYWDDARYVALAESLASGRGYNLICLANPRPELSFPPGWPLLLASLTALFPASYTALKCLTLVLWLGSIFLAYRLFAPRIESPYLEAVIALLALNPLLVGYSSMLMSETPYLFFSLLALCLIDRYDRACLPGRVSPSDRAAPLAGVWPLVGGVIVALYAQLIRTIGISLLLGLAAHLVARRRWRLMAAVGALAIVGLAPQAWYNARHGGSVVSVGYHRQVLDMGSPITKAGHVLHNAASYANKRLVSVMLPLYGPAVPTGAALAVQKAIVFAVNLMALAVLLVGVVVSLRRPGALEFYAGFYLLGVLAFWNPVVENAQPRFLIPLTPLLDFYFVRGGVWLASRFLSKDTARVRAIVLGVVSAIAVLSLARNIQEWRDPIRNRLTDLAAGNEWVRDHAPLDSIIMVKDPAPAYIYARRKTVPYPAANDEVGEYITANRVNYVIVSPKLQTPRGRDLDGDTMSRLLPALASRRDRYSLVYSDSRSNVSVFEVRAKP